MKNLKRRKSVKARFGSVEIRGQTPNEPLDGAVETRAAQGHPFTGLSKQATWIVPDHDSSKIGDLTLPPVQSVPQV
jgi:hypothetical protein